MRNLIFMCVCLSIVIPSTGRAAEILYTVVDLGTLGEDWLMSSARSINNDGQIVGYSRNPFGDMYATIFNSTGMSNNTNLGKGDARSINNNGQIVGYMYTQSGGTNAMLFDPTGAGNHVNLNAELEGSESMAYSINDVGQIVGTATAFVGEPFGGAHITLFDSTGMGNNINLGEGMAYSINNSGQIVGYAEIGTFYTHAVLFNSPTPGDRIDLGTLGGDNSKARSINDGGQIVGHSYNDSEQRRATLFDASGQGNNIDLGTLGGEESWAGSINNNGQIVGYSQTASGQLRATMFDTSGSGFNIDLNELIDPNLAWTLTISYQINDNGWIVGYGINPEGDTRAFLLTPVLETPIEAEVDIKPNTVNLRSKGKWIACRIWLPEEYDVADVNSYSVFLEDEIPADWIWFDEEQQVVMAKFSRKAVQEMLGEVETPSEVELVVSGELSDGTIFEGTDTIRVIDVGGGKNTDPPGKALKQVNRNRKRIKGP